MPSPVGHEIAGVMILNIGHRMLDIRRRVKVVILSLLVAILPDFDFIGGVLEGEPNKYHHGLSHSLFVGLFVCAVISCLFFYQERIWAYLMLFFSIYASHLFLDLFSVDRSYPYGLQLLWPLSNAYYLSPWSLFPDIRRVNENTEFFWSLISNPHNYSAILREIEILLPPFLAGNLFLRWRASRG